MKNRHTRRWLFAVVLLSTTGLSGLVLTQGVPGGFEGFWGTKYAPLTAPDSTIAGFQSRRLRHPPVSRR